MKGKKHRKRKILPVVLGTIGGLILAGVIVVFGFRVRTFEVEGNVVLWRKFNHYLDTE